MQQRDLHIAIEKHHSSLPFMQVGFRRRNGASAPARTCTAENLAPASRMPSIHSLMAANSKAALATANFFSVGVNATTAAYQDRGGMAGTGLGSVPMNKGVLWGAFGSPKERTCWFVGAHGSSTAARALQLLHIAAHVRCRRGTHAEASFSY